MTRDDHSPFVWYILDGYRLKHACFNTVCKSILIRFNNKMMKLYHKLCRKNVDEIVPSIKIYKENEIYNI